MRALLMLLVLASPAHADFEFAVPPQGDGDVYLWPLNAHLGYGYVADLDAGAHAFSLGVDVATFAWDAWVVDTALLRLAFRSACAEARDCGVGADFLVGSRVARAWYAGDDDVHQLSAGLVGGWGSIGEGFGGRVSGPGQAIVGGSVRYAAYGLIGLEVMALVPVVGDVGDRRPVGLLVNVVGLAGVILALATR